MSSDSNYNISHELISELKLQLNYKDRIKTARQWFVEKDLRDRFKGTTRVAWRYGECWALQKRKLSQHHRNQRTEGTGKAQRLRERNSTPKPKEANIVTGKTADSHGWIKSTWSDTVATEKAWQTRSRRVGRATRDDLSVLGRSAAACICSHTIRTS